jgi:hypothetical protein
MTCTVTDFSKDKILFSISGTTKSELDNKLHLFFTSEGYSIKSEKEEGKKIYKKGNFVLRIIFGAFAKYHQVLVVTQPTGDNFSVLVQRDASGISGGLVGMNQVRKEFARLTDAFKVYFN